MNRKGLFKSIGAMLTAGPSMLLAGFKEKPKPEFYYTNSWPLNQPGHGFKDGEIIFRMKELPWGLGRWHSWPGVNRSPSPRAWKQENIELAFYSHKDMVTRNAIRKVKA